MGTAILVHGAWQGAWCWEHVTPLLQEAGHRVIAPTLTGSGGDAARLSADIALGDHVADVVDVVDELADDAGPVVLVGHSYSGMVVAEVTQRSGDWLDAVVFVDSFYPDDGDSALRLMPTSFQERFRSVADSDGDGWRLPASDALLDVWGLDDPGQRRWVRERLTDWSLRCFESACRIPGEKRTSLRRWYVAGSKDCPSCTVFAPMAERAGADGCAVVPIDAGHDVMIESPHELADVILEALAR